MVYGSTANYNAGLALKDSKGIDDQRSPQVRQTDAPQAASTGYGSGNVTIEGVYPVWHFRQAGAISAAAMVTAIQNGTAVPIIEKAGGTVTVPLAINNEFLAIAYPAVGNTTKTRFFVDNFNQGPITALFNAVATSNVDSPISPPRWTGISYRIHTSLTNLTLTAANIELRNN